MADLTYTNNGMFTRFIPHTKIVWNQIRYACPIAGEMIGQIYLSQLKSVLAQLKKAGYSVLKEKPVKISKEEENYLFDFLVSDFS